MTPDYRTHGKLLIAMRAMLALLLLAVPAEAEPANDVARSTETLWSVRHFARMLGLTRSSDGQIVVLAEDPLGKLALFVGMNGSGPGEKILLPALRGNERQLVAGLGDTLWIGGTTNFGA